VPPSRDHLWEEDKAVSLANQIVSFPHAAYLAGLQDVPEPRVSGSRAFCPFGEFSHPDGGREKALRVYHDHGFCFAEWLYLSPVRIYALMHDLGEEAAAGQLLAAAGYSPGSWEERWDELVAVTITPDWAALAQALRVWLETQFSSWGNLQYDPFVSSVLARCLGLLAKVQTEADCETWLSQSKRVMGQTVRRLTWQQ
jgi:hypothetical protein